MRPPPTLDPSDRPRLDTWFVGATLLLFVATLAGWAFFFLSALPDQLPAARPPNWLTSLHVAASLAGVVALALGVRDLWLRPQLDPSAKAWWLVALLFTGGLGWLVYLALHFFRPRAPSMVAGTS